VGCAPETLRVWIGMLSLPVARARDPHHQLRERVIRTNRLDTKTDSYPYV